MLLCFSLHVVQPIMFRDYILEEVGPMTKTVGTVGIQAMFGP